MSTGVSEPLSIVPYLQALNELKGSDLHCKVGSPPRVRIDGRLRKLQAPDLTHRRHRAHGRRGPARGPARRVRPDQRGRLRLLACPASAGSASTRSAPAARAGLVFRRVSVGAIPLDELGAAAGASSSWPSSRAAWCSSPARPAPARPRRWPAWSTTSTPTARSTSSRSRTRSRSCTSDKLSMINQREVRLDTADFAVALRAAMRQDPDVILVGEMRDTETVKAALAAAETGHFVMSTLHTDRRARDHHPHHRLLPAARAEAGPARAGRRAARHHLPAARAARRRPGPLRRDGDLRQHRPGRRRDRRPGQDQHDHRADQGRRLLRHADLRPAPGRR